MEECYFSTLAWYKPSYSSSSNSSSFCTMFMRHSTSVGTSFVTLFNSRPGICNCTGTMLIASGWREDRKYGVFLKRQLWNMSRSAISSSASHCAGKNFREPGNFCVAIKIFHRTKWQACRKLCRTKTALWNFQPVKCPMSGPILRLACACRENEGNLRCSCSVWLPHLHVEQSVSFLQVACHSDLELPETKEVNTKSWSKHKETHHHIS